jgi:hypothetical protein
LLDKNIQKYQTASWKQQIDKNNFGLITVRKDLQNLEILVLEIAANKNKIDEDILKYVIEKWFKEMNVSRRGVYITDLPANTKTRIENFLN